MKSLSIALITALFLLYSCNSKQDSKKGYFFAEGDGNGTYADASTLEEPQALNFSAVEVKADEEIPDEPNTDYILPAPALSKKKIIKDGSISIETKNIAESKKSLDAFLKTLGAYYDKEDLQNNDEQTSYDLQIRIPSNNFEKLIAGIESGKDEVKSKSIQARDVTAEFIDIEARLANKREYLKRYKELLARASTVKDILSIEENIRVLMEEIESREGRLKYLADQVSLSTLNINLYQVKAFVYKPQPQDKFSERVKTSLSNGWTSVVNFLLWVITVWPQFLLIILAFLAIKRFIKKRKARK